MEYPNDRKIMEIKECQTLRVIGKVILICGILAGVILFLATMKVDSGKYEYSKDMVFNPMCIAYLITCVLPATVIWALFNVVSNISKNITELNHWGMTNHIPEINDNLKMIMLSKKADIKEELKKESKPIERIAGKTIHDIYSKK